MIRLELQRVMKEKNVTQKELEALSGVRQARISQICRGYADRLQLEHIDAICKALDVEPWKWIIYEKEDRPS